MAVTKFHTCDLCGSKSEESELLPESWWVVTFRRSRQMRYFHVCETCVDYPVSWAMLKKLIAHFKCKARDDL